MNYKPTCMVFVYGTLKQNGHGYESCQMQDQEYCGPAVAIGARLIILDGVGFNFPALVPSEHTDTCVAGELFRIDAGTLRRVTEFEGRYYRMGLVEIDGRNELVPTFIWNSSPTDGTPAPRDTNGNFHFPLEMQTANGKS